jgi:pimeloyl-ACP methyl ester carboxylesterase
VSVIRVDDVDLNVQVTGDGPPILLLHGFPDSMGMWREVTPLLAAAGHRVIAYDQRGYGDSSAPAGRRNYRIDRIVQDAVGVLRALDVEEPVTLVGHDWGAIISWSLAIAHPELIRRHVALTVGHPRAYRSAGLEQKRKGWYVGAFMLVGVAERIISRKDFALMRTVTPTHPDPEAYVLDMSRPGRLTAGLNWYRANVLTIFMRRWANARVPTMGVFATGDDYLAEDQMQKSSRYVDAQWEYVRTDGGHWLPLDQPERVAELILRWAA